MFSIAASASPELTPGAATPVISAERNMLKWLMTCGAVVSLHAARRVSSGTIRPPVGARVDLLEVLGLGAERAGRPARRRDTRGC